MTPEEFYEKNLKNKRYTWHELQAVKDDLLEKYDVLQKVKMYYLTGPDMFFSYSDGLQYSLLFEAIYPGTGIDEFKVSEFIFNDEVFQLKH